MATTTGTPPTRTRRPRARVLEVAGFAGFLIGTNATMDAIGVIFGTGVLLTVVLATLTIWGVRNCRTNYAPTRVVAAEATEAEATEDATA